MQDITKPRKGTYGETLDVNEYPFIHSGYKLTQGDEVRGGAEGPKFYKDSLEETLRYMAVGIHQNFCAIKRTLHLVQVNTVSSNLSLHTSEQNRTTMRKILRHVLETKTSPAAGYEKTNWEPKVQCLNKVSNC